MHVFLWEILKFLLELKHCTNGTMITGLKSLTCKMLLPHDFNNRLSLLFFLSIRLESLQNYLPYSIYGMAADLLHAMTESSGWKSSGEDWTRWGEAVSESCGEACTFVAKSLIHCFICYLMFLILKIVPC